MARAHAVEGPQDAIVEQPVGLGCLEGAQEGRHDGVRGGAREDAGDLATQAQRGLRVE